MPEPAVAQKGWHVNETLDEEYGRTMGCPRCSNRVGVHNAGCRGWIEGTMLRQSCMKQTQVNEPPSARTRTKPVPMESEKPTGPATQHGGSRKPGAQRSDVASSMVTRSDDEELPEVPDIAMDAEDSCEAQVKRARTIMGLDMCVLEAPVDTYDEAAGTMTNLTETCGENATGENVAAPEATEEPNQLKTFGGWRGEPTVDDTIPRGYVYSQKTEPVRGRLVDDMKNDRAKNRFVAAKVTRDVKHDVHAGTPALKALRTPINLATTRDEKHRLRNSVFYDTTATFVCASIDEVVGISPQGGLGKKECPLGAQGAPRHPDGFEAAAATLHENARNARVDSEQSDAWCLSTQRSGWTVQVSRKRHHGR